MQKSKGGILRCYATAPGYCLAAGRLNKSWYTALTRDIREPWALEGAKFSIRPNFSATLRKHE